MPKLAWTYSTLKTALQSWMEDEYDDFTGELDTIIGLAERRVVRDLDLALHDKVDTVVSTVGGTSTIAKPADCIQITSLYIAGQFVRPRSREYVDLIQADFANAQPEYYTDISETEIELAPTPDAAYSSRFVYNGMPDGLSDTTATTWIGDNQPDLLFYACLAASEAFDDDDENKVKWESDYQGLLPRAKEETKHLRRADFVRAGKIPQAMPRPLP